MFTLQADEFEQLVNKGMTPLLVDGMRNLFANCNKHYRHYGLVELYGEVKAPKLHRGEWAVANKNWQYASSPPSQGGGMAWVNVRRVTTRSGSAWVTDETFDVFLPVPHGMDPNLVEGDVFPIKYTNSGEYICEMSADLAIGSIRLSIINQSQIGWGAMNGTDNADDLGGTALDLSDNFLRGDEAQAQTTGGAASDTITPATIAGAIANHAGGTTGSTTIATHGTHDHGLQTNTIQEGTGVNRTVVDTTPTDASSSLDHAGHDHSIPSLSHSGTGGNITVDTVPPYIYVAYLERLNNSRNKVQTS